MITGNHAAYGGGIICNYSSLTITENLIEDNTVTSGAGGISCNNGNYSPVIKNNAIQDNTHEGVWCFDASAIIIGNTIERNGTYGISCGHSAYIPNVTITSNIIADNSDTFHICHII